MQSVKLLKTLVNTMDGVRPIRETDFVLGNDGKPTKELKQKISVKSRKERANRKAIAFTKGTVIPDMSDVSAEKYIANGWAEAVQESQVEAATKG